MAVKRNKKFVVKVSQFEWEQIKINSAENSLAPSDYLRLGGIRNCVGTRRAFGARAGMSFSSVEKLINDNKKLSQEQAAG